MPSSFAERLRHWRVGSVPYLNARPLIEGLDEALVLEVPSKLAARFARGELDAALVPVHEALTRSEALIADDLAIACRGEVYSVFLAMKEPLESLETIALDPASRTSSHLLQCLLAEFHDLDPDYRADPEDDSQARLLIGDPAIQFRQQHGNDGWTYLDLGAEWQRCTGLPFVFACWLLQPGVSDAEALAGLLREVRTAGIAAVDHVVAAAPDPAFVRRYLGGYIRYGLGDEEKRAIALFGALLRKHGLVTAGSETVIRYV